MTPLERSLPSRTYLDGLRSSGLITFARPKRSSSFSAPVPRSNDTRRLTILGLPIEVPIKTRTRTMRMTNAQLEIDNTVESHEELARRNGTYYEADDFRRAVWEG